MSQKKQALQHGVGRTVDGQFGQPDMLVRLDAQKRECDAGVIFHAGRALELALQVLYARGTDRIPGREYPGVPEKEIERDRKSHSLERLYARVLIDMSERPLGAAFEHVYQEALHRGLVDVVVDRKIRTTVFLPESKPFYVARIDKISDGVESTRDHTGDSELSDSARWHEVFESMFSAASGADLQTDPGNFVEFLQMADTVYYDSDIDVHRRRNMRWAGYSARDHEYGRPYKTIGTAFFARLVRGVIGISLGNRGRGQKVSLTGG